MTELDDDGEHCGAEWMTRAPVVCFVVFVLAVVVAWLT
jgi:hypothetical protein